MIFLMTIIVIFLFRIDRTHRDNNGTQEFRHSEEF